MKIIVIEIIISIILSYISMGVINCKNVKKANGVINKTLSVLYVNKKVKWYCLIMLVYQISLVFVLNFLYDNTIVDNLKLIFLSSLMWPMAFIDYEQKRIPNKLIILGLIYRLIILFIELLFFRDDLLSVIALELVAVVAIAIFIALCMLIMKGSIGMGDMKFLMLMALFEGLYRFLTSILAVMIIAFFIAIFLLAFKKKSKKDSFAFGPVISAGTLFSLIAFGV